LREFRPSAYQALPFPPGADHRRLLAGEGEP
jgi:hypothetical protein